MKFTAVVAVAIMAMTGHAAPFPVDTGSSVNPAYKVESGLRYFYYDCEEISRYRECKNDYNTHCNQYTGRIVSDSPIWCGTPWCHCYYSGSSCNRTCWGADPSAPPDEEPLQGPGPHGDPGQGDGEPSDPTGEVA